MKIRVIADVLCELTGDSMELEVTLDSDDFPTDSEIIQMLLSNISIVPTSVFEVK